MKNEKVYAKDYAERRYLSSIEAAKYLNISVKELHKLTNENIIQAEISCSGQKRYDLREIERYMKIMNVTSETTKDFEKKNLYKKEYVLEKKNTIQKIYVKNSMKMSEIEDNSVHLMITSPPYFDAKMYSRERIDDDLGNVHDLELWFKKIGKAWGEVYRVLQPGRKAFINIMNLPVREKGTFRSLNLVGRTIDLCENLGFVFKRDIVWHKTNGVKAHFGTYPYPGGILINNMHEFILEFEKPCVKGKKYSHLTAEQRERSKLDKEFWLSIKNSDVWLMNPEKSGDNRRHVAPFPRILPYRLIKAYSYVGETVLDPFLGSGTVLKVAMELERNGIGYEINPEIAKDAYDSLIYDSLTLEPNNKKIYNETNSWEI